MHCVRLLHCAQPDGARRRQHALAVALGDRDNHGRNTSLLKAGDGSVALAPLYDFAPMYLDPEGISRQTRWASERRGRLAVDWQEVTENLREHVPREVLGPALRAFGAKLEGVRASMADAGVDRAIIDARASAITTTAQSLEAVEG